jgi:hypothetical protein
MNILFHSFRAFAAAKLRQAKLWSIAFALVSAIAGLFYAEAKAQQVSDTRTTPPSTASARSPRAATSASPDNPPTPAPSDNIGIIEGDSIAVTGQMSVEVVHGQVKTVLRSGSDVRVKSGTARVDLVEGGLLTICGPAHLSLLKSASALTIALDSGTIHVHVRQQPIVTVYTAQIKAQPLSIGDEAQDLLVGFDTPGAMCVRANRGAVRIEQQLSGQSVVIPQSGDVLLVNGQLESLQTSSGRCACELGALNAPPEPQTEAPTEAPPQISQIASAEEVRKRTFDAKPMLPTPQAQQAAPKEAPIYQVIVPPLVYIANAKVQPEIDPAMIILVRRVRVRPTVIFQGRVLDEPPATMASATVPVAVKASAPAKPAAAPAPPNPSFVDRMRNYVHNLWSKNP